MAICPECGYKVSALFGKPQLIPPWFESGVTGNPCESCVKFHNLNLREYKKQNLKKIVLLGHATKILDE